MLVLIIGLYVLLFISLLWCFLGAVLVDEWLRGTPSLRNVALFSVIVPLLCMGVVLHTLNVVISQ